LLDLYTVTKKKAVRHNILINKNTKKMKKFLFTLLFSMVFMGIGLSQQVEVLEGNKQLSGFPEPKESLSMELLNVKPKYAENVWKDYIKQFGASTKKLKKGEELFVDNVKIPTIEPSTPIDLYVSLVPSGNNTAAVLWVDMGSGFVSSKAYPGSVYKESEKLLLKFAVEVARRQTVDEFEKESDGMKKLTKGMDKLKSKNTDLVDEIEKCKEKIRKAEKDIEKNKQEQASQQTKINDQQKVVDAVQKKLNDF
jgi:hypothetical protein